MQNSATMCSNCHFAPANLGYAWCQACYNNVKQQTPPCTKCGVNPANSGRKWCQTCFDNSKRVQQPQRPPWDWCAICRSAPGIPAYKDLCSSCHARVQQPPPRMCTNCHTNQANPGRNWCQQCFLSQ